MPNEEPKTDKPSVRFETVVEAPVVESPVEQLASVPETSVPDHIYVKQSKRVGGEWLWVVLAFVLGGVVGGVGGFVVWGKSQAKIVPSSSFSQEEATVAPTAEPSPTISVSVKRSDLKVKVLNGSGVVGAASLAKTFLESMGYKGVSTGNADKTDVEKTSIAIKVSKREFLDTLRSDLGSKYTLEVGGDDLDSDSVYDVVVTLGLK